MKYLLLTSRSRTRNCKIYTFLREERDEENLKLVQMATQTYISMFLIISKISSIHPHAPQQPTGQPQHTLTIDLRIQLRTAIFIYYFCNFSASSYQNTYGLVPCRGIFRSIHRSVHPSRRLTNRVADFYAQTGVPRFFEKET